MRRPSQLTRAEAHILATLYDSGKRIFTYHELRGALSLHRQAWGLTRRISLDDLLAFLERNDKIHVYNLVSEAYGQDIRRYSLTDVSAHELALSLRAKSYLSHGTAAELHGLIKQNRKRIYVNAEQSEKTSSPGTLDQGAIDAAYARKQSTSKLIYKYKMTEVVALNGKQTGQFGVVPIKGTLAETLIATNLERTLVDIAVRPAYAGGASEVLKAYRTARDKVSIDLLIAVLQRLGHKYPFHQSIGFLMSLSDYSETDCGRLAALGINHDFYVDYDIKQRAFSQKWRVYYPADWQ